MQQMEKNQLVDEQLKQLAISAQQQMPLTQARQLALTQLVNGILQSGRLCHPQRGQFSKSYADIYDEACQDLLLYICQHIDKYQPERGSVMAWVNVLLERRFFREAIVKVISKQEITRVSLSELENLAGSQASPCLTEILQNCIKLDATNILKKEHIRNYPAANFQALLLRRISDKSWQAIATEFNLKIPTLSSFYYRCLTKYSEVLKECCNEQGI